MKIVFLDSYTTDPSSRLLDSICSMGDFTAFDYTPYEKILERASEADILIVNKTKIDEYIINKLDNLKFVCVAATGYNNVDTINLRRRGIPVSNVSGYSTFSVAQQVFASLFAVRNRSEYYFQTTRDNNWSQTEHFCYYDHDISEINEEVFGIIGFGDIGKKVAGIARSFGCKVLINTANPSKYPEADYEFVEFDKLISESDIISIHVPLTDKTSKIINDENLRKFKSTATIINTSRGGLIDEMSLYEHLRLNPNFTAILDVLETEPAVSNHPFISCSNCFITPHIAWSGKKARVKLVQMIKTNILAFLAGTPVNLVN